MSTPVALFCFLVLAFFIIFLRLYGEDFIPTVFHKRNKFWSLVWIGIFLLCTGVIIIPRMMKKIPDCFNVEVKILGVTCTRYVLVRKRIVSGRSPNKTGILARDARHASILL